MGEIRYAWNVIWKNLKIFGNILIFLAAMYFIIQSNINMELFYYLYVKPIADFIDLNILPLFSA